MSQPPEQPDEDLTLLLQRMHRGDRDAGEKAAALVYDQLHRIASGELRGPGFWPFVAAVGRQPGQLIVPAGGQVQRERLSL